MQINETAMNIDDLRIKNNETVIAMEVNKLAMEINELDMNLKEFATHT